jgi:Tfp pilus assembly protein PilN
LVIVPRLVVKRFYDFSEKLKMKVEKVVFAPEAIIRNGTRYLHLASEKNPVIFVHIDRISSDFGIVLKGHLLFIRNLPLGTQDLTTDKEASAPRFVEEVKKSLEAYQGENIEQNPANLILTGAVSGLEHLSPLIQESLGLPVKRWQYEEGLPSREAAHSAYSDPLVSFYSTAASALHFEELAMDLVPEENKVKRAVEERGAEIVKMGILVMIFLSLICANLLAQLFFGKAQMTQLEHRFDPIRKEAKSLEQEYMKVQTVRTHLASRGKSIETLAELYNLMPQEVALTDVRYDGGEKASLKGTSLSRPSIYALVSGMEASDEFKNVQTKYVSNRQEEGKEYSDFEISASLEEVR